MLERVDSDFGRVAGSSHTGPGAVLTGFAKRARVWRPHGPAEQSTLGGLFGVDTSCSEPPLRGARKSAPPGHPRPRSAVQLHRLRHAADNAGHRGHGVRRGRPVPGVDGLRLAAGRRGGNSGAGPTRLGPVGAGSVIPMATAPFAIPFCITAVTDGGPATLMALTLVTAAVQIAISRWLFILRRVVTPTVGGTVMMILSITLSSVVFGLLDDAAEVEPVAAPVTAFVTLVVVAVLLLRGSAIVRLWAPVIGIVVGCVTAAGARHLRAGRRVGRPLGRASNRAACSWARLRRRVLDAHPGVPVPGRHHLHPGERGSRSPSSGSHGVTTGP